MQNESSFCVTDIYEVSHIKRHIRGATQKFGDTANKKNMYILFLLFIIIFTFIQWFQTVLETTHFAPIFLLLRSLDKIRWHIPYLWIPCPADLQIVWQSFPELCKTGRHKIWWKSGCLKGHRTCENMERVRQLVAEEEMNLERKH